MAEPIIGITSLAFVETFHPEEDVPLQTARQHAAGTRDVRADRLRHGGAALRFLAAAIDARAVVEVGTGAGTSRGSGCFAACVADGVLTTVDIEGEHQRAARQASPPPGSPPTRYRLINGQAGEVLPRFTDGAYDLVFVDADKTSYPVYYEQAVRLLQPGGIVAFDNALWHDRVADSTARDVDTVAIREVGKAVRDDPRLVSAMLPVSDGLLAAVKR